MFASMKRKVRSCFSEKTAGRLRELVPLAFGLLLTAAALAVAGRRIAAVESDIRRQAVPVDVVVAKVPIGSGDTFSEGNLAKKGVPAAGTGQRNVPASEFELLLGARSKTPLAEGEPVLWTDVEEPYETETFSRTVVPGHRALTLGVDVTSSFAGLLHPGDRVDLLCEKHGKTPPFWIRDLSVAAVDRDRNRLGKPAGSPEASTVTLMVTPEEGARISAVSGSGKLHWFLRNPEDNTVPSRPGKRDLGLSHPVEVWKAGVRVPHPLPEREGAE